LFTFNSNKLSTQAAFTSSLYKQPSQDKQPLQAAFTSSLYKQPSQDKQPYKQPSQDKQPFFTFAFFCLCS
jgi:hypothetical protein